MNYLFFLIIFLIPVAYANAEVGKNFDTEELGNGLTQWTSHYDRIYDGNAWQNYILTNDGSQIKYESSGVSFQFDKTNCDFKLYDPVTDNLAINSYQFDISVDGVPKAKSICDVVNLIETADEISFTIDRGDFKTNYDLNTLNGMEWTHEIINKEGKNSTFTITETCKDCNAISIVGDNIDFGAYTLDTKNKEHKTLKNTKADKGDYVIEYEKILADTETLLIDPIFTFNDNDVRGSYRQSVNGCTNADNIVTVNINPTKAADGNPADGNCQQGAIEFNIASIPTFALIRDVDFQFEITGGTNGAGQTVNIRDMDNHDISVPALNLLHNDVGNGTIFNSVAYSVAIHRLDLGTSGDAELASRLTNATKLFAVGMGLADLTRDGSLHQIVTSSTYTLIVSYMVGNAVTDLIATDIRPTAVDLDWTTPSLVGGESIQGYQINKTTPWNINVATVIKNSTNSTATAITVSGLTGSTKYSFRVGPWFTSGGNNMTGNVLNITTDFDPTGAFTVGTFNITQTGPDTRPMTFERDDINATALFLNVTYSDTVDLACDLAYKFANTNNTYVTFTNSSAGPGRVESPMLLLDVNNEIIDVHCFDENGSNATGRFLITQTAFPLLSYIDAWRNGEFGTSGDFGVLDFITLIAIIISMVGMNRVNPSVGLVFSVFIIGGLAVFGIIEWPTIMTAGIVLIAMFIIGSTRKDD